MIVSLTIAIIGLALAAWYFKSMERQAQYAKRATENFFKHANAVVEDVATPDIVLDMIDTMTNTLRDKSAPKRYCLHLLTGKARKSYKLKKPLMDKLHAALDEMPTDIRQHFFAAVAFSLFATSFQSLFYGTILRRFIMFDFDNDSRARKIEEPQAPEHLFVACSNSSC